MEEALLNLILPRVGSSIKTRDTHQAFINKLSQTKPAFTTQELSRRTAGSIGGALAQGTIKYRGNFIVRVR